MFWEKVLTEAFILGLLAAGIRLATPLLLAALGEIFAERAGILNIGVDGMMLIGALCGFLGSYYSGSPWVGALTAMLGAGLISLIHAYLSISLAADQVVSGIAVNLLSLGLATFLNRGIFGLPLLPPKANSFSPVGLPLLSQIPFLGPIFFNHHALVYTAILLVPICYIVLFKTTWGLRITAVGEDPRAAEAVGIDVSRVRYGAVFVGGLLAGLAGATLSLAQLSFFKESIVAGRGYIAIAVVMFGRWNPLGALAAALIFGIADAFQLHLQAVGVTAIPSQLLLSLPYLVTILALLSRIGKTMLPKALAIPYVREE
jgi:simple sugar transport system permease protein